MGTVTDPQPHGTRGIPLLQALLDAFNAHDVDAIMSFFTEDCILRKDSYWKIVG